MRICTIPNCGRPHRGHGYCNRHLLRHQRFGDPLGQSPYRLKLVTWLKKASRYQGDDCLDWPFSKNPDGYGQFKWKGMHSASRVMCYMVHGKPPTPKHEAAHSCHRRPCVNPRHLSWQTVSENRKFVRVRHVIIETKNRVETVTLSRPRTLSFIEASLSAAIAASITNTAVGVTKALRSAAPPLNFINASLVAAAGAEQIEAIRNRTVTIKMQGGQLFSSDQLAKFMDAVNKKRTKGASLQASDIQTIRKLRGQVTGRVLANRFGVSPSQISSIQNGRSWEWVNSE